MFSPIPSSSAIGFARSLERIIDFMTDMKNISLPSKLTNDFKVNLNTEKVLKEIELLGNIRSMNSDMISSGGGILESNEADLMVNDFSKPKNKL